MDIKKWEDCPREDLNMIPAMGQAGWQPRFKREDLNNSRNTPDFPPHYPVRFERNISVAWKEYNSVYGGEYEWCVAELVDGRYVDHRRYATLAEVIEKE